MLFLQLRKVEIRQKNLGIFFTFLIFTCYSLARQGALYVMVHYYK